MPSLPRLLPILLSIFLQGCLATWMRMEDGTVLAPGRSEFAMVAGSVPRPEFDCDKGWITTDSLGRQVCEEWTYTWTDYTNPDGSTGGYSIPRRESRAVRRIDTREPHFAMMWRLGALGPFGPFTGLQLGIQAEGATNPVSQEYHLAVGLPGSDSLVAHSLIGGWGTGLWADNSWFLQYAASRRIGVFRTYGSVRATLQASQFQDLFGSDKLEHRRTWDYQAAAGVRADLPSIAVLPDWVVLGATVDLGYAGYPGIDAPEGKQPSGLGMAWGFGMGWGW
jgi:hypothetical protein